MRIIRHARPPGDVALAIGSFDGVHLGHHAMFAQVVREARARGISSAALTFEPLPREFFAPREAPARLSSLAEKLDAVAHAGIDIAIVERFDREFAAIAAPEFEERIARHYSARWVLVGQDFRYGAGRRGNVASLEAAGARLGFDVQVLPAVMLDGARVSSTRVREALAASNFPEAARLLGRPYVICGRVVHGRKRGRGMGFPTANVRLARPKTAVAGIFAVKCFGVATRGLEGVASLGTNPAVQHGGPATLEAFLFDFSGDLYGRRISLEFVKKLRDEAHFASMDELAAQIRRDCDAARQVFRNT
jgi:riboflavin kinase/FMN adenylyltransferase